MTEIDLIEAIRMTHDGVGLASMNFTAVLFGYLAAAYVVGRSFSRMFASLMTVIFTSFAIGPFLGVLGGTLQVPLLVARYREQFPDSTLYVDIHPWLPAFIACLPLLTGWVASVLYLHYVVRK